VIRIQKKSYPLLYPVVNPIRGSHAVVIIFFFNIKAT